LFKINAQNAAITCVQVLDKFVFCCGPDQRLNIWKINEPTSECTNTDTFGPVQLSVNMFCSCVTEVQDVSSLDVTVRNGVYIIVIVGTGLQVIEISMSSDDTDLMKVLVAS